MFNFGNKKKLKAAQSELIKLYAIGLLNINIPKYILAQSVQRMIDANVLHAEFKITRQPIEDEENEN